MDGTKRAIVQRLLDFDAGRPVAPLWAEVHPTDDCNHDCIWCIALSERQKAAALSGQRLLRLMDELADSGVIEVLLSGGGDPLQHPDIRSVIERGASRGMAMKLITNAGNMTEEHVDVILQHCASVRFSLDAGNTATHRLIHRPSSSPGDDFETIVQRISQITRGRRPGPPPHVMTSFVLHSRSIQSLGEFLSVSQGLGVDGVDIKYNFLATRKETEELFETANIIIDGFSALHPEFPVGRDRYIPRKGVPATTTDDAQKWPNLRLSVTIDASGDLYPCCHLTGNPAFLEGNVQNRPFQEVWFDPEHLARLAEIETGTEKCIMCIQKSPGQAVTRAIARLRERRFQ